MIFVELSHVKWIGLITNVVETKIFEINIVKGLRARTLYIGDNAHTILFKYEICTIDKDGTVINSVSSYIDSMIVLYY